MCSFLFYRLRMYICYLYHVPYSVQKLRSFYTNVIETVNGNKDGTLKPA
jgi:hypothetical protein